MQTALPGTLPDSPLAVVLPDARTETVLELNGHHLSRAEETFVAPARPRRYVLAKRGMDILLGLTGLLLTVVIGLVVAPWIKVKSPDGPLLFRQTRLGKDGKPFTCYKFRTMEPDAESRKRDLAHLNEASGPVFKMMHDPRHVPSLRWLRRFSIDEMPQFWNVVRGDMSLVGPRPPIPDEVAHYTPRQLGRLTVKPGMTCTWQVNGRSNVDFDHWVEMDLDYIERRSTALDLALIVKTIPAVVSGRGAG